MAPPSSFPPPAGLRASAPAPAQPRRSPPPPPRRRALLALVAFAAAPPCCSSFAPGARRPCATSTANGGSFHRPASTLGLSRPRGGGGGGGGLGLRSSASDVSDGGGGGLPAAASPPPASTSGDVDVDVDAAPPPPPPPPAKSAAVLEAERLRARARSLLAEAAAEESALRSSLRDRKTAADASSDAAISSLLAVRSSVPAVAGDDTDVVRKFAEVMDEELPQWVKDREAERVGRKRRAEAMAEWMRAERITTARLLEVVERIYERERIARSGRRPPAEGTTAGGGGGGGGGGSGSEGEGGKTVALFDRAAAGGAPPPPGSGLTFQIGASSNVAEKNEAELRSLDGLMDEIVDAAGVLDEKRRAAEEKKKRKEKEKRGGRGDDGEGAAEADGDVDGSRRGEAEEAVEAALVKNGGEEGGGEDGERHYGLSSSTANVLRSRIKDLRRADDEAFKRRLASEIHAADRKATARGSGGKAGGPRRVIRGELREGESIENFVRRTMAAESGGGDGGNATSMEIELKDFNASRIMMDIMRVPMWVPASILPYVITCPDELDPDDAKRIKAEVLSGSTFLCSGWDSFERAAVYRGTFRDRRRVRAVAALSGSGAKPEEATGEAGNATERRPLSEEAFADVRSRLEAAGLADRVQLFLMDDPEWRPGDAAEEGAAANERAGPPPILLAVPASVRPEQGGERGNGAKFLAGLSAVSTLVTAFAYGVSAYALNPDFFNAIANDNDASALAATVPVFLGVLALQAVHEAAHYIVAKSRGVKIGMPVPLPSLQIGTFGCITPLRSFPETRADLMDVALAGPGAAMVLSVMAVVAGIGMTAGASEEVLATLPVVPAALMKSSFLVGSMVSVLAPKVISLQLSQPIPVHPLFMVGLAGLISSALNLLPIGRLDGGRASAAAFGRRPAILISLLFLLVMAAAALSGTSQISIFWGLLVTVFQRNGDVPPRDERTAVDGARRGLYGALTALAVLALLPFPGGPGAL